MNHETSIKAALTALLGDRVRYRVADTRVILDGTGTQIEPDAVIDDDVVVEIEARTAKQIRGGLMDLLTHPFPRKLLIVRPVNANRDTIGPHCDAVMAQRLRPNEQFEVVVLHEFPDQATDNRLIREALTSLGVAL